MDFKKEKIRAYYLHNTHVENVFINEYMAGAPGDFVKTYLLALMYTELQVPISNEAIARELGLSPEDVLKAWSYWEEAGVIKKHLLSPEDPYRYKVEFLNLKEQLYGKNGKKGQAKKEKGGELPSMMDDKALRDMYGEIEQAAGRLLAGTEMEDILGWIRDYKLTPEAVVYAFSYCAERRGNSRHKYVETVLRDWASRGLATKEKIEEFLQENDSRQLMYRRILKALGLMRNPTEEEKRLMDLWFDQMEFSMEQVLDACRKTSGISNPNIKYVNGVLGSWHKEKKEGDGAASPSGAALQRALGSYEEDRSRNEEDARRRKEEIYRLLPRIREIDEEMRRSALEISRQMVSGEYGSRGRIRELKTGSEALLKERESLLEGKGYRKDYTDVWYTCPLCRDTGILESGERCPCINEKIGGN
ncbi:MAG: DnaD domain protein [Bacillota bacterium]|nr:DnaD domain protein [Bacillota bacterium]